jgi:hypothetical protein
MIAAGGAALFACSDAKTTSTTQSRGEWVCIYGTTKCFPSICDKCTLAGYGKCPPTDTSYSEICSEDPTEGNCRDRAVGPQQVSPSSDQLRYTRDVRILRGIGTCAKFRESGEAAATAIERVCSGVCP